MEPRDMTARTQTAAAAAAVAAAQVERSSSVATIATGHNVGAGSGSKPGQAQQLLMYGRFQLLRSVSFYGPGQRGQAHSGFTV